jgi:aryl-alcohol dehydrogenase-like predicted oxidoreductase
LAVAEQLGCSPSAVATAWAGTRHVVPIIGPRTHEQLVDNLSAVGIVLDAAHLRQLDEASAFELGYPHDLLAGQRSKLGFMDAQTGRIA